MTGHHCPFKPRAPLAQASDTKRHTFCDIEIEAKFRWSGSKAQTKGPILSATSLTFHGMPRAPALDRIPRVASTLSRKKKEWHFEPRGDVAFACVGTARKILERFAFERPRRMAMFMEILLSINQRTVRGQHHERVCMISGRSRHDRSLVSEISACGNGPLHTKMSDQQA